MLKINLSNIKHSRVYVFLLIVVFVIYGNSINNEYSLDDNIVVEGVEKVDKGLSGIKEIFTTHHAKHEKQLYGYRPIVALSFAIEKQFFSKFTPSQTQQEKVRKDKITQANISHFFNVLIYAVTAIYLFVFLKLLFNNYNIILPLVVTLIFVVHPLHTEPVANIKSRDELLMMLGLIMAMLHFLRYGLSSKIKYILYAVVFVFISLLSKKSGLAILGVLPVIFYYKKISLKQTGIALGSVIFMVVLIVLMKKNLLTDNGFRDVKYFENPLLYEGTLLDRVLTGFYCSWFYLKMLIYPFNLSYYYGYNVIPIASFSHYQVWLGVLIFIPLGIYGFWSFIRRQIIGLGIVLWLGVMLAFLNVLFPIVGIVADRFTYLFSLGFCVVLGFLLLKTLKINLDLNSNQKLQPKFTVVFSIILLVYSTRVIARNPNWHDKLSLFRHDIKHLEKSAKANSLIANVLFPRLYNQVNQPNFNDLVDETIHHYKKSIEIYPGYITSYNNLGATYINYKKDYKLGITYCKKAIEYQNSHVQAHYNIGYAYLQLNKPDSALYYFIETVKRDNNNVQALDKIGLLAANVKNQDKAINLLKPLVLNAKNPHLILMQIGNLYTISNNNAKALEYFVKAYNFNTNNKRLCFHILNLANQLGNNKVYSSFKNRCN